MARQPPPPPRPQRTRGAAGKAADLAHFLQKSDTLRKAGNYKEAIQVLDRALLLDPQCTQALSARGAARRALLQREEALADYSAAIALEPKRAAFISSRGTVKSELGWYRDAIADFMKALKLEPDYKVAKFGMELVKTQQKDGPLRMVVLTGFKNMSCMNMTYVERRQRDSLIHGRESFWSLNNKYVLYFSIQENRWKGCRAMDVDRITTEASPACVGAPEHSHLLSPSLRKGWFEWSGRHWVKVPDAGVFNVGPVVAALRIVTLQGFQRPAVNTSYMERRQLEFTVNSRETYWSVDEALFIYWCPREARWRGTRQQDLEKIQKGESVALFGAPRGSDILSLKKGWHELQNKEWVTHSFAGTVIDKRSLSKRTVTLAGFAIAGLNGVYVESRKKELMVNDREIYHSNSESEETRHFLYWSKAESRWKGSLFSNLQLIQEGRSLAVIGAPQNADLLDPALLRGWHEWADGTWSYRALAGVALLGSLGEDLVVKDKALRNQDAEGTKKRKRDDEAPRQSSPREELIKEVFAYFDSNRDGLLKASEMLSFARSVGFDGTEDQWDEEYRLICDGLGRRPEHGIDHGSFFRLVNEDTDDGCYCSDKELAGMLGRKWPPPRVVS
eukprot:s2386_g2.t1